MSIKKELLDELTEKQLVELAENKGIKFNLSNTEEKYYKGWDERDKIVDIMSSSTEISIKEIEEFLKINKDL